MAEVATAFYCMRCDARFDLPYDVKVVRERTCPKCLSNSVRRETPASKKAHEARSAPLAK